MSRSLISPKPLQIQGGKLDMGQKFKGRRLSKSEEVDYERNEDLMELMMQESSRKPQRREREKRNWQEELEN